MTKSFTKEELEALGALAEERFYRAENKSVNPENSAPVRDYWKMRAEFWLSIANKVAPLEDHSELED